MCTVSYLPLENNGFILTSNRDVPYTRKKANEPKVYEEGGVELNYPKDGEAGGTWIGTSSKNRLICLLNGGFYYHTSRSIYKKSRGLIVNELLKVDDIKKGIQEIDLNGVEQFTLTIVDWNNELDLFEFVWDGVKKHLKKMKQEPQIWSSATLYDREVKKLRKDWFVDWQNNNEMTQETILNFHKTAGIGDPAIDIKMDRKEGGTVSITSVLKEGEAVSMNYESIT
jgi:hypothetical protein|tara:strand:+ start:693 stop:1370 length:678 start_codon:yes stop_codon:yes gene_type:complete